MVFIRAPIIDSTGEGIEVLAEDAGHPVLVQRRPRDGRDVSPRTNRRYQRPRAFPEADCAVIDCAPSDGRLRHCLSVTSACTTEFGPGYRRVRWTVALLILLLLAVIALAYYFRYELRKLRPLDAVHRSASKRTTAAFGNASTSRPRKSPSRRTSGLMRARLYLPEGVSHPHGMVAVHGIHHLGMDEPRLVSFAKAIAGSGLVVLTPQIDSLADYHVDGSSIPMIGESAVWLDGRLGGHRVTVTGN